MNPDKSHIAHSDKGVKFLGVEIGTQYTRIQPKKLAGFKAKLKNMTGRNGGLAKAQKRSIKTLGEAEQASPKAKTNGV